MPASSDQYKVPPDHALMQFAGESRGFSEKEAVTLDRLLDVLSEYSAESVTWWGQGQGIPIDSTGQPFEPHRTACSRTEARHGAAEAGSGGER